jgi:chemotaxis protein CheD
MLAVATPPIPMSPATTPVPMISPQAAVRKPSAPAQGSTYVHPGRLVTARGDADFTTVVGSGAVVCVWDPVANVAGMVHFLLPEKGSAPPAPRFGDVALQQLMDELSKLGANAARLRAHVYGGSAPPIAAESGHLGERNVHAATAFLATQGIPLLHKDVGGSGGRKVVFLPASGRAEVVRLNG